MKAACAGVFVLVAEGDADVDEDTTVLEVVVVEGTSEVDDLLVVVETTVEDGLVLVIDVDEVFVVDVVAEVVVEALTVHADNRRKVKSTGVQAETSPSKTARTSPPLVVQNSACPFVKELSLHSRELPLNEKPVSMAPRASDGANISEGTPTSVDTNPPSEDN
jgi:hypothetical protein